MVPGVPRGSNKEKYPTHCIATSTMAKRARIASGHRPVPDHSPEKTESAATPLEAPKPDTALPSTFKIVVGTYEKLLYGLEGRIEDAPKSGDLSGRELAINLKPVFIFPAHVACVRAVAASPQGGKWLATGSTDEIVKVWDLRRRKEVGGLIQHQGSITRLSFPSRSHLLSASEDGTLSLFSTRDWALLRTLKGHKGKVNDVSMHPSGKLALSVGKDRTLRMWDMMRGKGSASTKLGKDDEPLREFLLVAAEDKFVTVYQIGHEEQSIKIIAKFGGHSSRYVQVEIDPFAISHWWLYSVKALDILPLVNSGSKHQKVTLMSTASSDGKILVYNLSQVPTCSKETDTVPELKPMASYDTKGSRLVCLTMADGDPPNNPGVSLGKRAAE
ncbi:PAK1IP1 protein [Rhizoctonia solani AG-1 IA]|uniref:PAK1IP1 protein n=1 Tax=Thanatephorus cucumeris (strain AG1-IA) TaxID=983506 RepID=L8X319_THACA|nr:PAK1IP1 protein [Rhizoctonia solani AG-1 IA]